MRKVDGELEGFLGWMEFWLSVWSNGGIYL